MPLSGKQKRFLRAEAHGLDPVVMIGKEGLTPTVVEAVQAALLSHELIKVRVLDSSPIEQREVSERLPAQTRSELAGEVGRVLILYKRHPQEARLVLPRESKA
ncbi:MAG: RNA-binding protein [Myxococcaceae bacterium]|nr:RNA-binding protein [Myxococcaceae bacterium]